MDLLDTKEILETNNHSEANKYIKLGWKLVQTYKTCYDPDAYPDHQDMHYVLVWLGGGTPQKPRNNIDESKFFNQS